MSRLPPEIADLAARLSFYDRACITAGLCAKHIDEYHERHPLLTKLGIEFPIRKWKSLYRFASAVVKQGPPAEDNIEED